MPTHRRLAAVLAADVVGYSRLIGSDEERTIARLRSIRTQVVDPAIAANHGRLVRITGDGLLVEFASVIDALRCASEVQRQMAVVQRRSFPGGTDRLSDRHQRRRDRDRRRRRHCRRWRQHCRPARSAGRRRRHLRLGTGPGGCGRQAGPRLRGHGRAYPEEHRSAGAALSSAARRNGGKGHDIARQRPIAAGSARQAFDRRPGVHQHEQRDGTGILCRRSGRGHHYGPVEIAIAVRHRPQFELHLQRQAGRDQGCRPRTRCALCSGRQRAQGFATECG